MRLTIPYGQGFMDLELPSGAGCDKLEPRDTPPLADPTAAVREALQHPIGTPPLRKLVRQGQRVAILVSDITRRVGTDLFLPVLVDELNRAGIPDAQIFAVFALGNHRAQTPEEQRRIVGENLARRIALFNHDCRCRADLVSIGRTRRGHEVLVNRRVREADGVILTGGITYHPILGYSGGRKSLFPGVAGEDFIRANHSLILDSRCRSGLLEGNPAHEDLLEACRMFNPDFLLNMVMAPSGEIAHVVAGHYELAHRAGCELADRTYGVALDKPYDVVVAGAGGFPFDIDLRQAHKGIAYAVRALKEKGTLVYFAECRDGSGTRVLEEWVRRFSSAAEMAQAIRAHFELGAQKAYPLVQLAERYHVLLVSSLEPAFVRRCHLYPAPSAREAEDELARELAKAGGRARIGYIPNAGLVMPLPRMETRAS